MPKRSKPANDTSIGWEFRFPLVVFLWHWLIIQSAVLVSSKVGEANAPSPPYGRLPDPMPGLSNLLVEPLRNWDGLWYTLIAQTGYVGGTESAKAAFWPLFPWLMQAGSTVTGLPPETVGYLIANCSFAIALIVIYRLVRIDFTDRVARRTLWAIALFPTALFFQAVYTESLFLALAAGALLFARIDRWWIAGTLAALAALTRSHGVLLALPMLLLLWQQRGSDLRRWWPQGLAVAMPAIGPALFAWHLHQVQGNARAFIDVQAQWDRYSAAPWQTLRCAAFGCDFYQESDGASWDRLTAVLRDPLLLGDSAWRLQIGNSDILELTCMVLFLVLAVIGLWRLPLWMSAFTLPGLLIPLFSPSKVHALMSMPRFGIVLFPLFVVLALILRPSWFARVVMVLSACLLFFLTVQFAQWYWVS
ncbi:MAG: glycosyltransferase family 39 protein [Chloroflexota bacterium]